MLAGVLSRLKPPGKLWGGAGGGGGGAGTKAAAWPLLSTLLLLLLLQPGLTRVCCALTCTCGGRSLVTLHSCGLWEMSLRVKWKKVFASATMQTCTHAIWVNTSTSLEVVSVLPCYAQGSSNIA